MDTSDMSSSSSFVFTYNGTVGGMDSPMIRGTGVDDEGIQNIWK
jgi:hypothetical protein